MFLGTMNLDDSYNQSLLIEISLLLNQGFKIQNGFPSWPMIADAIFSHVTLLPAS